MKGKRMIKKATMADIAEQLGISKNSVSLALRGKQGVSDELRAKIAETATALSYGNFYGRGDDKSRCILAIVPEYLQGDSFFYSDIFWAVEAESKLRGCISIHIGISKEMEETGAMPSFPKEVTILGLIVIGVLRESYVEKLFSLGYPMLSVDIAYHAIPIGCVGSSNLNGGFAATKHLIDNGHAKIGFIGPIFTAQSIYERWCGYQLAMRVSGLYADDGYCVTGKTTAFQLFDAPESFECFLDEMGEFPTAWFCGGDRIAVALIQLLSKRGVRVPGDVSVIGFDDIPVAQMIFPRLTTIRIDRKLMGRLAVSSLLDLSDQSEMGKTNINISGKLVVRESVKKLGAPEPPRPPE
ncbi:MAG: substrate-binding domain-containing protein [Clostridiales bacterium]|nr:substrate-binding domain-containing protein [Clostridiales bacterium]